jgi:hypothetical protein
MVQVNSASYYKNTPSAARRSHLRQPRRQRRASNYINRLRLFVLLAFQHLLNLVQPLVRLSHQFVASPLIKRQSILMNQYRRQMNQLQQTRSLTADGLPSGMRQDRVSFQSVDQVRIADTQFQKSVARDLFKERTRLNEKHQDTRHLPQKENSAALVEQQGQGRRLDRLREQERNLNEIQTRKQQQNKAVELSRKQESDRARNQEAALHLERTQAHERSLKQERSRQSEREQPQRIEAQRNERAQTERQQEAHRRTQEQSSRDRQVQVEQSQRSTTQQAENKVQKQATEPENVARRGQRAIEPSTLQRDQAATNPSEAHRRVQDQSGRDRQVQLDPSRRNAHLQGDAQAQKQAIEPGGASIRNQRAIEPRALQRDQAAINLGSERNTTDHSLRDRHQPLDTRDRAVNQDRLPARDSRPDNSAGIRDERQGEKTSNSSHPSAKLHVTEKTHEAGPRIEEHKEAHRFRTGQTSPLPVESRHANADDFRTNEVKNGKAIATAEAPSVRERTATLDPTNINKVAFRSGEGGGVPLLQPASLTPDSGKGIGTILGDSKRKSDAASASLTPASGSKIGHGEKVALAEPIKPSAIPANLIGNSQSRGPSAVIG